MPTAVTSNSVPSSAPDPGADAPGPREQLRQLTRAFRTQLEWRRRAGVVGAPIGPLPVPPPEPAPAAPPARHTPDTSDTSHGPDTHADPPLQLIHAPRDAHQPALHDSSPVEQHMNAAAPLGRETLAQIRDDLGDCTRCRLAGGRASIVFGVGAQDAPLMFIGEAPGAVEDRRGEPFVGPAGQLLDRMIAAMGWTRESVYIANVIKCRPPDNRDPMPDEIDACRPFLERQIASISPRVIVTLGRPAAHLILRTDLSMSVLRGKLRDYRGVPVMPTYHPAFLLRSPERKRDTWEDLKQVIAVLERVGVTPPRAPRT